uniref:FixG protein n=1 Tax=Azorhizobium caulinodans TaxID=7 RepID=Q43946_AZOCA|nr:fixG [Azorhizobium caulinodans ORS 571]
MTSAALKPEKSPKAPAVPDEEPLYAARRAIYPQSVHGRLRTTKWVLLSSSRWASITCCPSCAGTGGRMRPTRPC